MTQYVAELELQFEEVSQSKDSFHIQVTVLGAGGNPIDDAVVTIAGAVTQEDTTVNGKANFDNIPKDTYEVTAEKDGETVTGYVYEYSFKAVEG